MAIIVAELDLDDLKAKGKLKQFESESKKRGKNAGESFGKGFAQSFLGNVGANLVRSALSGIRSELNNIVAQGAGLEVIETQFRTFLKSTELAEKQLADLQAFAATTPFQLPGLAASTNQLLSFGIAQENIIPTLRQLGDLAAGTGARIDELTIPFGRLVSTQKLTLVELDKFADRGINLYGKLSEQTGISLKNIRDEVSKGRVPFDEFTKALNSLTQEGGLFFGATEKQSKTLAGTLSTLGDNLDNARANLGKLFSPLLIKGANAVIERIQSFNKELKTINLDKFAKKLQFVGKVLAISIISPLEFIGKVGKQVFLGLSSLIARTLSGFANIGFVLAKVLNFTGIKKKFAEDLIAFEQATEKTANNISQKVREGEEKFFQFDFTNDIVKFTEQITSGFDKAAAATGSGVKKVDDKLKNLNKSFQSARNSAEKIFDQGVTKAISGGIQTVIQSIAKGENALAAFGQFILSTFGDLAIQLGEFYIAQGIANAALLTLDPTATIAAGAALVALGSILKSFAGGGLSGTGGVAASGGALATAEDRDLTETDEVEERLTQTVFNIEVQGSLVQQEELGRFITEVQNEAREKNGILDTSVRVV